MTRIANKNNAGLMGPGHVKLAENSAQLTKEFVASGAIASGQFVALRSDGKVEAVTGTETLASIGGFVDIVESGSAFTIIQSSYNAVSNKVAVLYFNNSGGDKPKIVIGTVSGSTLTFGAPVVIDSTNTDQTMRFVWNTNGTKLIFAYLLSTPNFLTVKIGDVSGTGITLGTAVPTLGDVNVMKLVHDDTHGSRVIIITYSNVRAMTYSGTVPTVGTYQAHNVNSLQPYYNYHYNESTGRLVFWWVGNKGFAATFSGITTTIGTTVNISNAGGSIYDVANNRILLFSISSPTMTVYSYTVSGTTITGGGSIYTKINTSLFSNDAGHYVSNPIYDSASGKYLLFVTDYKALDTYDISKLNGITLYTIDVSAGGFVMSDPIIVSTAKTYIPAYLNMHSNGRIVMVLRSYEDYSRYYAYSVYYKSGSLVIGDKTLINSALPTTNVNALSILGYDNTLLDFNSWSAVSSNTMKSFAVQLPTETSNRENWIGQANITAADTALTKVKLRGSVATGFTGLTPGTIYYLKGDGTLMTTTNGVKVGIAISATEILMENN